MLTRCRTIHLSIITRLSIARLWPTTSWHRPGPSWPTTNRNSPIATRIYGRLIIPWLSWHWLRYPITRTTVSCWICTSLIATIASIGLGRLITIPLLWGRVRAIASHLSISGTLLLWVHLCRSSTRLWLIIPHLWSRTIGTIWVHLLRWHRIWTRPWLAIVQSRWSIRSGCLGIRLGWSKPRVRALRLWTPIGMLT